MYDVSDRNIQIYKNLSQNKKQNLQFLLFQSMHVKQKKTKNKTNISKTVLKTLLNYANYYNLLFVYFMA